MKSLNYWRLPTLGDLWQVRKDLIESTRLLTTLFAFFWVIIGFGFFPKVSLSITTLTAIIFAGITGNIMTFNDIIDRNHDVKKAKCFAYNYTRVLTSFWMLTNIAIWLCLAGLTVLSAKLTIFCATIWLVGILYSFIPRWFFVQNVVVATCSASPVLCGLVYHGEKTDWQPILLFVVIFGIILVREIFRT